MDVIPVGLIFRQECHKALSLGLFCYINDMTYANSRLFADDATLFSVGKDVHILHTNL